MMSSGELLLSCISREQLAITTACERSLRRLITFGWKISPNVLSFRIACTAHITAFLRMKVCWWLRAFSISGRSWRYVSASAIDVIALSASATTKLFEELRSVWSELGRSGRSSSFSSRRTPSTKYPIRFSKKELRATRLIASTTRWIRSYSWVIIFKKEGKPFAKWAG